MRRVALALVAVVAVLAWWVSGQLRDRPSLAPYARLQLPPAPRGAAGVRVTFGGVSTLAITDGETTILTDAFFTRPGLVRTAIGMIAPDEVAVDAGLARLGVASAAAVVVVHSHYDHAMDAPIAAERTGAVLVGSASTANVARGLAFPEERIRVARFGDVFHFGAFTLRLLESRHFPHGMAMGEITSPLVPPARATDYKEGGSYSVVVEHPAGTLLVHGSAGFLPGALDDVRADVVLLGIGALGTREGGYRRAYWRAVVGPTRPRLVVPIHWDDFTRPLAEPLVAMPRLLDDVEESLRFLEIRTGVEGGPALGMLPPWEPVVLLPAPSPPAGG